MDGISISKIGKFQITDLNYEERSEKIKVDGYMVYKDGRKVFHGDLEITERYSLKTERLSLVVVIDGRFIRVEGD